MFSSKLNDSLHKVSINDKDALNRIKGLVEMGANINSSDAQGDTILHKIPTMQDEKKSIEIFNFVIKEMPKEAFSIRNNGEFKNTPLIEVMVSGKHKLAKLYVEHCESKDLELRDHQLSCLNSPLMLSIKSGWTDIALKIIKKCPKSITILAADNFSALHYACLLRQDDVIKSLLENGANLNAENNFGAKPLQYYEMKRSDLDVASRYIEQKNSEGRPVGQPIFNHGHPNNKHLRHAVHFQGINKKGDVINNELLRKLQQGTSLEDSKKQEFKSQISKMRRKALLHQLDIIRKYKPLNELQQKLTKQFDENFAKDLSDRYSHPEDNYGKSDKQIEEEVFEDCKKKFKY